jgi:glycosyltransferase involved in cell wall biosynthesis
MNRVREYSLVSVIIPVYQAEKYLWHCAESVMEQSYKNIEIILIDDGSTDRSPDICDNLARMDQRVRVIHQSNGGVSSARNTGLHNARGEYIAFLDSDDFLHRHFIKYLLFLSLKHQAQMSACGLYSGSGWEFEGISMKGDTFVYSGKEAIISRKIKSGVVGKLYKKEIFNGLYFPVSDHLNYEDEALIYKLLYRSAKVVVTKKPLYYIYQNQFSATRKENHYRSTDFYGVLQDRILFFADKDRELLEYSYEYLCLNLMRFYFICKTDAKNKNNMQELLMLYEKAYYKVLYNEVTPFKYKLMFTAFYLYPELCAVIANKAGFRIKKWYGAFIIAKRRPK